MRRFSISFLLAGCCFAQFPNETDRLMATARLWVTIDYFHPSRDTNWDQALIAAIPKVRAAANQTEFRAAIAAMLGDLHDPDTYLLPHDPPSAQPARQLTTLKTATSTSFLISDQPEPPQTIVVELSGLKAAIRLSRPISASQGGADTCVCRVETHLDSSLLNPPDPYPNTELRLLAAIKTWAAIHYFFAYKDLMDEDWDEIFPPYLTKFIAARNAIDYNLTLTDLLTHLTDTNSAARSKTLDTYFGETPVGLRLRLLDKYPIVTEVLDPIAKQAGVQPGDVVKRIGGVSTTDIFRRFVEYIPASTAQRSGYDTIQKITSGPIGSEVELSIENAKGELNVVKLTRAAPTAPQTESMRILTGNVGYLDLSRLPAAQAESALDHLKDTKAIIFDLRGGQTPAASIIARHLTSESNVAAAIVTTPIAMHPDIQTEGIATETASTFVVQTLPVPQAPHYKGKTIALIDERTIGDAEYAALLFEAANKTEFIGAPTAGADSRIAELPLPGGITLTYSTQDIRHANGGKLQRLGIQPNIPAPTTANGLRAGKDEPLEAALAQLNN